MEKRPTKKEIKKYFENAKEVKSIGTGTIVDVSENKNKIHRYAKALWVKCEDSKIKNVQLWNSEDGYAKILSYKEPKEKTYKITREQVLKYNMKDEFPEVFETKLTVGKWYKYPDYEKWNLRITEVDSKAKRVKGYGFGSDGVWMENALNDSLEFKELEKCIEMTEQEVTEALTKEAVKRGYKNGQELSSFISGSQEITELFPMVLKEGILKSKNGCWLFKDGVWASILKDVITKAEAEAKLNCKIV